MAKSKINQLIKQADGSEITVADAIVRAVNAGAFFEDAAQAAGISKSTLYDWIARGEEHRNGNGRVPKREKPYLDFSDALKKARASAVIFNLAVIHKAAKNGTWQAAAWWLERTRPAEYGRRTRVEAGKAGGGEITFAELMTMAATDPSLEDDDPDLRA